MNINNIQWRPVVAKYARPDLWRSIWQIVNTLVPYIALFYLSIRSLEISFWLTLPLSIFTAGFMVRTFIIFHDCGHGSFFKSREANKWLGRLTGFLVFTPFQRWTHDHAIHHATAGNLDRRGKGDVYTMTVDEYLDAPWWKKFGYRVMRQPVFMFLFGSLIVFVITQRIPGKGKREQASVWSTNLALAVWATVMSFIFGWKEYLIVQLLVIFFGASVGIWLFYIQHNFEDAYWERHAKWDFLKASLQGSSYYKLPAVLQWFTGNIGFHHIHHLSPKIPNYKLPKAFKENPIFHIKPLTLWSSFKSLTLRLYDEKTRKLVGWRVLKRYRSMTS
ncbi:MAG: fatty acid desaturase [Anaerolineales bacterium]|jgi:omega-6 fatty acid desaturase (delta-12 desaturase)